MPIYCYETEDGKILEKFFVAGQAPRTLTYARRKQAIRAYAAERKGFPPKKGWPLTCFASGVNAEQAGELRTLLRDAGVPTEVTPDGDPVYRDAAHRKKALKARGMVDKSSFL